MSKFNKEQLVEIEDIQEENNTENIELVEENLNVNAVDDVYYDLVLSSSKVRGTIMYRKLSGQNVIEIYADGVYTGGTSDVILGTLPVGFRPAVSKSIYGYDECNSVWGMDRLFINADGTVELSVPPTDVVRGFAFFGVMRI